MAGISYGGGSPTGDAPDYFLQATEGMGGYPHSGQGLPSGITGLDLVQMLRAQKAQKLAPVRGRTDAGAAAPVSSLGFNLVQSPHVRQ